MEAVLFLLEIHKMHFVWFPFIFCLSALSVAVNSWKTENWPPAVVYQHYDVPGLVSRCSHQCNPNMEEVKEFELTTDMKNLPNSKSLRCYFNCFWVELGVMKPGSVVVDPTDFFELMDRMTKEEQDKYMILIRGCTKRLSKIKDPIEVAYQAMVCGKQNSNELFYLFY